MCVLAWSCVFSGSKAVMLMAMLAAREEGCHTYR